MRDDLVARGIAGELDRRGPPARGIRCPTGPATPMRVALGDLRYDRRTRPLPGQARRPTLPSGETTDASPTSGRVDELVEVAVPTRPIARGETIAAADVAVGSAARRRRCRTTPCAAPRIWSGGRRCGRSPPGRAARAGEVAAPWQVRRGDDASMAFSRGGLQIVTAAEVLENGRQGQTIRVRNAASGEVRQAVVVGPRRVEVLGVAP